MAKKKRKRMSKGHTKDNAARGGGGGNNWFNLPDGVNDWHPEEAGSYMIDVVPYEVTDNDHPDRAEPGALWYKRRFFVHHGVGSNEESVVCPRSVGKPCPICEERQKLEKKGADEETLRELKPQQFVAFNVLNPEDAEQVSVFTMSYGKFAKPLLKELEEDDGEFGYFYQAEDGGHTIKARFSDASFGGRKYIECTRIDFRPRDDMDEDEILEQTVNLDEFLIVKDYEKLRSMLLQMEADEQDEDEDEDEDEQEEEAPNKRGRGRPKKDPEPEPEDEDDDEDEDDEDDEPEPPKKRGRGRPKKEPEPEPEDDDEDDEEEEPEPPKKRGRGRPKGSKNKKKEPAPEPEDDDDDEDDEEEEEAPKKRGRGRPKGSKNKTKSEPEAEPDAGCHPVPGRRHLREGSGQVRGSV
jgi:hypothetical protein